MRFKILIVDDEIDICHTLSEILNKRNFETVYTTDPLKVISILQSENINLVLLDLKIPEIDGIQLLKKIKKILNNIPVIMISGHARTDDIVTAMKYGALNFYTKPLDNTKLINEINKVVKSKEKRSDKKIRPEIITDDNSLLKILKQAGKVALTDASIIITGESGTGKELVADYIHQNSLRKNSPFIKINCAAIPENLLESEMFGHEKGAFTDAIQLKKGQFELAENGSILLDEIGDMSLKIQAKMLRVLQEKQFTRVGGSRVIEANCRIITATNKDLGELIKRNLFREDLYYRLSIVTLHLPSLRNRKDDILLLSYHFLKSFNEIYYKNIKQINNDIKCWMLEHKWPGNIRELKNFIERAVIFSEGDTIDLSVIPDQYKSGIETENNNPLEIRYKNSTKELIIEALLKSNGKKQKAAELLNIDRKTLYRKLKKFNIEI